MKYLKTFKESGFLTNEMNFNRNSNINIVYSSSDTYGYKRHNYEFVFNNNSYKVYFVLRRVYNISYWERAYGKMEASGDIYDRELNLNINQILDLLSIVSKITIDFVEDKQPDILVINHRNMNNEIVVPDNQLNKRAKMNCRFLKNKIPNNYTLSYYSNNNLEEKEVCATTCIIYKKGVDINTLINDRILIDI